MPAKHREGKRKKGRANPGKVAKRIKSSLRARDDRPLRQHLLNLLDGENAHLGFDNAVADFSFELWGLKPDGLAYSAWQIVEHLRIAQWDILEFSRNSKHVSPKWPEGYWPSSESPPNEAALQESLREFRADLKGVMDLVRNPSTDLFARIPHGDGQTILREALLVADHNAYHIGQVVLIRRLLGAWSKE